MANKLTDAELAELVKRFQALEKHDDRVDFFEKNPELGRVIRQIHFQREPKVAEAVAAQPQS